MNIQITAYKTAFFHEDISNVRITQTHILKFDTRHNEHEYHSGSIESIRLYLLTPTLFYTDLITEWKTHNIPLTIIYEPTESIESTDISLIIDNSIQYLSQFTNIMLQWEPQMSNVCYGGECIASNPMLHICLQDAITYLKTAGVTPS